MDNGKARTPDNLQSRFGALVNLPRRIVWKLVRPYVINYLETEKAQFAAQRAALRSETNSVKKDLMATNQRINWLEESTRSEK
jgi:hypothetical protein